MTNFDVGQDFGYLNEFNGQTPCNPQKAYSGGEFLQSSECPADQDVHGTLLPNGSLVCEDQGIPIFSGEWAKGYFNVDLRTDLIPLSELGINIVGHEWQNVPESNDAKAALEHSVPGKVTFTTKDGGKEFIHQMKQLQTPCTQGIVWEKDLAVHNGQYTEGEHFQSVNDIRFSGSFGTGFICVDLNTHKRFFLKQVKLNKFRRSEVLIPINLDHEHVTKLYGVIQRDQMVDILMEDAGMSLACFVQCIPRLEERLILGLTKHALAGLKELHQNNVIHHDIKPENLCVCTNANGSVTLKVTDFGSARSANQPVDSMAWTPAYLAPEACRKVLQKYFGNGDEQITGKVDIFALALTVLFMFEKQHVLLHKMTQVSYKDLSAKEKQTLDLHLLQYLAVWTSPPQDLFPKECSVKVQQLLTGMLLGSQDLRFSAGKGLACIESFEIEQNECQQTQNGRLVTHPSENHQDAGEMSAINGGVRDLTKEKLRNKMLKKIKEHKVLEGGTDVLAMTKTGRQNPKMETNLNNRSVNATIQASEMAARVISPWPGLHPAQQAQVSTKPAAQNSIPQHQADISLSGKPEKRKHGAELRQHTGKKMRQSVSGVPALPAPAIPNSVRGLSKYNMMDGEMKPRKVDDNQPLHKDTIKPIEEDSATDNQEGNIPDFSKLF